MWLSLVIATITSCSEVVQSPAPDGTGAGTGSGPEVTGAVRPGVWLSRQEIRSLPMEDRGWWQVRAAARVDPGFPDLSDQDQDHNVYVLAKALVWARTGEEQLRDEVREHCMAAIDTELDGRTLALARELAAYVIAADIVKLEPEEDEVFRAWLRRALDEKLQGRSLRSTHEDRPNNWGTHAGASRAAVAVYLGDSDEIERTARVFKGWLGDREAYAGFQYGSLSWQADPDRPVGVNPVGSARNGVALSGSLPDDMRRGGGLYMPPGPTGYAWEALQGALVTAEILYRQGYDTWNWEDRALLRAAEFLHELHARYPYDGWNPQGDDEWMVWLLNHRYGTSFPTAAPARHGKNMGWTDWTHPPRTSAPQGTN